MRIAVVGASGRVGREVVRQALGHGDEVLGLTPDPDGIGTTHARLHPMRADVHDLAAIRIGIAQADAVVSVFGHGEGAAPDHYERGIANVLRAMAEADVERLVATSVLGALVREDLPFATRLRLFDSRRRTCYDDLERMERRILASGVNWTILRPIGLAEGELTGRYRTGLDGRSLPKGRPISRADLAAFALKALSADLYSRRAVSLAY